MADLCVIAAEPAGKGVVPLLERVLADARAGRLSSVAVAYVDREGCTTAEWSEPPSQGLLLGAIARLAHRFNLAVDSH